jgi:hypothetical protein
MSAWPEDHASPLQGLEGELVSVRITIEPRLLEKLLEVLAGLEFPINPQLYHDAATVDVGPDGARRVEPAAVVEFPAWAGRIQEIRAALAAAGFERSCLSLTGMLDDIHAPEGEEPAPPGAHYKSIVRSRRLLRAIA